jgi:hypothetical protein
MRLIKCRKCGATIATDETFIQRMLDDINILSEKARKDRRNYNSYLQQAAAIRKIMQQYLHRTAQMDAEMLETRAELGALICYVRESGLITDEKLSEITTPAREKARARIKQEEEMVNELYRGFENISINRTKADPTERKGIKKG